MIATAPLKIHIIDFWPQFHVYLKAMFVYNSQLKCTHLSSLGFWKAYFQSYIWGNANGKFWFQALLIFQSFIHPVTLIVPTILRTCFIYAVLRKIVTLMRKLCDKFRIIISRGTIYYLSASLIAAYFKSKIISKLHPLNER